MDIETHRMILLKSSIKDIDSGFLPSGRVVIIASQGLVVQINPPWL